MKSYEQSWLLVSIVKKKNRKKKRRMPFKNHCCSMCVWSDVFILLFKCISVSVPPSYDVGWWKNWARLTNGGKKQRLGCVGVSNLALSTPPPPNPPVNHQQLTWTAHSPSVSPSDTHTETHTHTTNTPSYLCVCGSMIDLLRIFWDFFFVFFFFFFCSSLYCMDDPSYCDKESSRKDFKEKSP